MHFKCLFGCHRWNGCKCTECGKTRDSNSHVWDEQFRCNICGVALTPEGKKVLAGYIRSLPITPARCARSLYDSSAPSDIATDGSVTVGHTLDEVLAWASEHVEEHYRSFGLSPDDFELNRELSEYTGFSRFYRCESNECLRLAYHVHYDCYYIEVAKHGAGSYSVTRCYPCH